MKLSMAFCLVTLFAFNAEAQTKVQTDKATVRIDKATAVKVQEPFKVQMAQMTTVKKVQEPRMSAGEKAAMKAAKELEMQEMQAIQAEKQLQENAIQAIANDFPKITDTQLRALYEIKESNPTRYNEIKARFNQGNFARKN